MAIYVVMEPDQPELSRAQEKAFLIRDGFSFWAFVLPVIWLLAHRLWIEALAALALMLAAGALATQLGSHPMMGAALSLLTQITFGLEAANLRVAALRRRGWHLWGPVEAANRGEAELRYAAQADTREITLDTTPWPRRSGGTNGASSSLATAGTTTFPWER